MKTFYKYSLQERKQHKDVSLLLLLLTITLEVLAYTIKVETDMRIRRKGAKIVII